MILIFSLTSCLFFWFIFKTSILRIAGVVREDDHQIVVNYFFDKGIEISCDVTVSLIFNPVRDLLMFYIAAQTFFYAVFDK